MSDKCDQRFGPIYQMDKKSCNLILPRSLDRHMMYMSRLNQSKCCMKSDKTGKSGLGFFPIDHQDMLLGKKNHLKKLMCKRCIWRHCYCKLCKRNRNPDKFYQLFFRISLRDRDLHKLIRLGNKDYRTSCK